MKGLKPTPWTMPRTLIEADFEDCLFVSDIRFQQMAFRGNPTWSRIKIGLRSVHKTVLGECYVQVNLSWHALGSGQILLTPHPFRELLVFSQRTVAVDVVTMSLPF